MSFGWENREPDGVIQILNGRRQSKIVPLFLESVHTFLRLCSIWGKVLLLSKLEMRKKINNFRMFPKLKNNESHLSNNNTVWNIFMAEWVGWPPHWYYVLLGNMCLLLASRSVFLLERKAFLNTRMRFFGPNVET